MNALGTAFAPVGAGMTVGNTIVHASGWAPGAPDIQQVPGMAAYSASELGGDEFMDQFADGLASDNRDNIFGAGAQAIGGFLHSLGFGNEYED